MVLAAAVLALVGAWGVTRPEDWADERPDLARALAAGALAGTAGTLAGLLWVRRGLAGDDRSFLTAVVGSSLLRLGGFGAMVAWTAWRSNLSLPAFLAGLGGCYLGLQAAEMVVLHRAARARQGVAPPSGSAPAEGADAAGEGGAAAGPGQGGEGRP